MSERESTRAIYDEIESWAESRRLTADEVVQSVVDAFYEKNLTDERILRFFEGADLNKLRNHQFNFLRHVFSEGRVGNYTGNNLYAWHKRLIEEEGLNTTHFDCMVENLVSRLEGAGLPQATVDRVSKAIIPMRMNFSEATNFTKSREERLFGFRESASARSSRSSPPEPAPGYPESPDFNDGSGLGPGNPQSICVLGLGVGPHLRTPSASQSDISPSGLPVRGAAPYSSLGSWGQPVESGDSSRTWM